MYLLDKYGRPQTFINISNAPGLLPPFGKGRFRLFLKTTTYTPEYSGLHRIRVLAAGGDATFYGSGYTPPSGGSSSFGNLISATGGQAGITQSSSGTSRAQGGNGSIATPGAKSFTAKGGQGSLPIYLGSGASMGGGGAGSQLGPGGDGSGGGGGVGGGEGGFYGGGSAFGPGDLAGLGSGGPNCLGVSSVPDDLEPMHMRFDVTMRFPFEAFPGGGGSACLALSGGGTSKYWPNGGPGAGGASRGSGSGRAGAGGWGGGSGGPGGPAGFGGGGCVFGGSSPTSYAGSGAGGGYAHDEISLDKNTTYTVTVAAAPTSMLTSYGYTSNLNAGQGFVLVELLS